METPSEKIIPINIEEEMRSAYIDYSMSVIVSRALPDVRDGLKPVHRRILYGMMELGLLHNRPYKKSARIVGEVLGKYHPHGDSAVYETMVRMAQSWSMRYRLVDGQGNFGSVDGDNPAAMRYTEARLTEIAEEMLTDIDKNTVDFAPNFDDSLEEPTVLPAGIPNLLVNGAAGIAVGMATNMAPHNLGEVIDGTVAYIQDPQISIQELMAYIPGPDFPTAGTIHGVEGIRNAYENGKGSVVMRAKAEIETLPNGRERIIVTEIPYQVNKAAMIAKTADLVNDKVIEGISDIRDESDRKGMRIVYELKRDVIGSVVLNKLYKFTALQSTFSINNIALHQGRPIQLNLKDIIRHFVNHRHDVVVRRTKYELEEAEKRAHILQGLIIAIDNLDEVIALIRGSRSPEEARNGLIERFELSEVQAKAILDMRLQKLTGLEREKLRADYEALLERINYYRSVLESEDMRMDIIKTELEEIKEKFADERRTTIEHAEGEINIEDLIAQEDVVITISHMGYLKRTTATEYKKQSRGGRGSRGAGSKEEDFIEKIWVASTHDTLLFFTEKGRCHWLKVYEIPNIGKTGRGRAAQNLVQLEPGDRILTTLSAGTMSDEAYLQEHFILFATEKGVVKKTPLEAYSRPRAKGINAISINEDDQLLEARLVTDRSEVVLASTTGLAVRFSARDIRAMGRTATGVRGIRLEPGDAQKAVGMITLDPDNPESILVLSENGYGKRSNLEEYRLTRRGGKGVRTMQVSEKTGNMVAIKAVRDTDDIMIINRSGITIRTGVEHIRVAGRATMGVRLIKVGEGDKIAAVARVENPEEADEVAEVDGHPHAPLNGTSPETNEESQS